MTTTKHIVIDARIRRSSTGRYTDRLLEHLQKIDHSHHYTILLQPDDPWEPTAQNFTVLPCPYPQFSFNPLHEIGFARQLYRLKPDLVHFTMTQQPLFYFGNIVTTTHDLTMLHFVRRGNTPLAVYKLKMGLYRFLLWWGHRKSKDIIVPSHFVANDLSDYQPFTKDKINVTYEASEPPLPGKAVKPDQIGKNDEFIMYLGNAFPHKNIWRLIEAFDLLYKKHPNLKLILVGKTEKHYLELAQRITKLASAPNIILTGFLPDEQAKWLHQHCLAYVYPSLADGWGLTPLEAMAHGSAVIASNASCIPEVLGNAAYYFDATNPEDIAQKINDVLSNPKLRSQLGKSGLEQVKKYSWSKMAKETLAIYKKNLGENTKN